MSSALLESPGPIYVGDRNDSMFEVVDGETVDLPEMSLYANTVALRLFTRLAAFAEANDLGQADHEILYNLNLPKPRNRRPDVSFVSYKRWPKDRPYPYTGNAQHVVPDLAVEVLSPNDTAEQIDEKISEYFAAGVELVWVIYCHSKRVHVYESIHTPIRVFAAPNDLDGGDVLPGFRFAVASLFPPRIEDEA